MESKRKDPPSQCNPPRPVKKLSQEHCIIHFEGIKTSPFTSFSSLSAPKDRLDHLKSIGRERLAEPLESANRMTDVCLGIPSDVHENDGYHQWCYQRFTQNLHRLVGSGKTGSTGSSLDGKSKRRESLEKTIFKPDCIFCNKDGKIYVRKQGTKTKEGTSSFERDGWRTVVNTAEENRHKWLLRRIRGYDLFAAEAQYHPKCRKQYTANPAH